MSLVNVPTSGVCGNEDQVRTECFSRLSLYLGLFTHFSSLNRACDDKNLRMPHPEDRARRREGTGRRPDHRRRLEEIRYRRPWNWRYTGVPRCKLACWIPQGIAGAVTYVYDTIVGSLNHRWRTRRSKKRFRQTQNHRHFKKRNSYFSFMALVRLILTTDSCRKPKNAAFKFPFAITLFSERF